MSFPTASGRYETEGANHSLETGDVEYDIDTIKKTMKIIRDYVREGQ